MAKRPTDPINQHKKWPATVEGERDKLQIAKERDIGGPDSKVKANITYGTCSNRDM